MYSNSGCQGLSALALVSLQGKRGWGAFNQVEQLSVTVAKIVGSYWQALKRLCFFLW